MQISELPDGMEQLSDAEVLACTIFRMIDEGDEECLIGIDGNQVVSITELSLMLCDVLRSQRLGVQPTPATRHAMDCMSAALAIYRASNRV